MKTYGPRTAWFCSNCGADLMKPGSRCNCGGGAVPAGPIETGVESGGAIAWLRARVAGLIGRQPE